MTEEYKAKRKKLLVGIILATVIVGVAWALYFPITFLASQNIYLMLVCAFPGCAELVLLILLIIFWRMDKRYQAATEELSRAIRET